MRLFLRSWPTVSHVCFNFPQRIIGRKTGARQIRVRASSVVQTRQLASFYKHVNMLEHLRGDPRADSERDGRWMADHISELKGYSWVIPLCLCLSYVCRREDSCGDVPINHSGHLSAGFKSRFGSGLRWAPAKAKRLSWSNDCH